MKHPKQLTLEQRAMKLLETHGGNCSIAEDSELLAAFQEMESAGLVAIHESGGTGFPCLSVRAINFTPMLDESDELC